MCIGSQLARNYLQKAIIDYGIAKINLSLTRKNFGKNHSLYGTALNDCKVAKKELKARVNEVRGLLQYPI